MFCLGSWSAILSPPARQPRHGGFKHGKLREIPEECVCAELALVADEQGVQEGGAERRSQHCRDPDGIHPRANQLPPGVRPEAGQRALFGLPQDAKLRRPDTSRRARQVAEHVAALQD